MRTPHKNSKERNKPLSLEFIPLEPNNIEEINKMSDLARSIVKEHFDPIIGSRQNDYMISLFQTPEAISSQMSNGYQYYFVMSNSESIGFLAYYNEPDELYLSKFYLQKNQRGKGYSREMLEFLKDRARENHLNKITLNVNRNNFAVTVYQRLGFKIINEQKNDIGHGFVMDDFVMQCEVEQCIL